MTNRIYLSAIALAAGVWACEGKVDVGAVHETGDDGGAAMDAGVTVTAMDASVTTAMDASVTVPPADGGHIGSYLDATPPDAGPACVDTAPSDGSCQATCCTPAGAVTDFATTADLYAALAGRWQFCSGQNQPGAIGAPADAIGIEFVLTTPPDASCTDNDTTNCGSGNVYYLVQGPSGPVRGSGFDYQLTYNAFPVSGGPPSYQLNLTKSGTFLVHVRYSPCPTEFAFDAYATPLPVVMVPFY